MKHLLHYFPNHPREEECYIRLAGYREEEEIDELIYRTVGRVPGSEFLFRGNRGKRYEKKLRSGRVSHINGSRRNRKPGNTETAADVEQFPVAHFSLLCYQVSHESAQAVHAPVCVRGSLFLRGNLSGTGRTEGKKKPFGIHAG